MARDFLAALDGEDVLEVEDCLFPVGVFGVGAGRKADGLVARGEVDIKPGHEGVDEVVALDGEFKGRGKGEVGHGACVEVEGEDGGGVCDCRVEVYGVDERLRQSRVLERRVVEAVDIVPD